MRCTPAPGLRWRRVDDAMVLFDPSSNGFVELDASGAELWERLVDGDWHEPAIVTHLVDVHHLDPHEATTIVAAYLDELTRLGVIARA